ncbi:zinc-binding dehydrogenase, partial [Streptomyces sp. NPDC050759]|uniref:zinc-binding dehydrogenase n=1 Tax=Streptomyces sp. NPDC050759 TaxID=3365635 RepID=UPI0037AB8198
VMRPVETGRLAVPARADGLHVLDWHPLPELTAGSEAPVWWVLDPVGDAAGVAESVAACAGARVERVAGPAAVGERLAGYGSVVPDLVMLAVSGGDTGDTIGDSGVDLPGRAGEVTGAVLEVVQAWLKMQEDRPELDGVRLAVCTRGAIAAGVHEDVADLAAAGVWGLVRSAQSEHPGSLVLLDHDLPAPGDESAGQDHSGIPLHAALTGDEPQLALRSNTLTIPRLTSTEPSPVPEGRDWVLGAGATGSFDDIGFVECAEGREPLSEGQVRLSMRAAGLNFRDVAVTLGMVDGGGRLGNEGAGIVLEVGPGVTEFAPGDRVMGLVPAVGPVIATDHRLLAPIPNGWTFAQAATTTTVFLTAYHALVKLADLRPGETVLIHAGTGGVGMAATQIAQHIGARVLATASPAKWPTLRGMGIPDSDMASSRTTEFEEQFSQAARESGVDVVLNSLTGEFIDASLRLMTGGGRFIEIGKTDVRDAREIAESYPGCAYEYFDLLSLDPGDIQTMLRELLPLFEDGTLRLLPVTVRDVAEVRGVLRHMSQAQHTGKLALRMPTDWSVGTVVVTGGTGLLGGLVARWLVERWGVGCVVLASR